MAMQQIIPEKSVFFTGETVTFKLSGVPDHIKGKAVLRTDIGGVQAKISEQIEKTILNRTPKGTNWKDLDMSNEGNGIYSITLPLTEPGVFEAKCCFIPSDNSPAIWPVGDNFSLKIFSSVNAPGNGIYCCFVRQFGKWMHLPESPKQPDFSTLDEEGFTVIPPSGTFRNVIAKLDHIFNILNCRILQLLPVHPVPVSFGRMGRYGSPFAATDYFAVDPALADFDTNATPMEQFVELIDAVHARGGRIFMDLPVNHTGWASKLQNEHPDYFVRDDNGKFISPGAWGVIWADLCQLDYKKNNVHDLMAKVMLFWCRRGIDGFRCDAGYMVPIEAWKYIIARVRQEYPDTTFLLEGLGGPLNIQEQLLEKNGLDWGYSELFQNYTRDDINSYYPYVANSAKRGGILVNFAETHDNMRLASNGKIYARSRFLVNALLSVNGSFGFANGAEFFASEKIDVHQCGALNFGAVDNLCDLTGKLNALLATHPAFRMNAEIDLIQHGPGNVIAARRYGNNIPELIILLNLNCNNSAEIHFKKPDFSHGRDLLTGKIYWFEPVNNDLVKCRIQPGDGICLAFDDFQIPHNIPIRSEYKTELMAAAMAQNAALNFVSLADAAKADGKILCLDPEKFISHISGITPAPVTSWNYPADRRRNVMIPPGDLLLIKSPVPFIAELRNASETINRVISLCQNNGDYFALVRFNKQKRSIPEEISLEITAFDHKKVNKVKGKIILLADPDKRQVRLSGRWNDAADRVVFGSNIYGSYAMFNAQWGEINSKYDAILAISDNPVYPVDRHVMFTSCRAWLVVDEYSRELNAKNLETYAAHPGNKAKWNFLVPDGRGGRCKLDIEFKMAFDKNCVELKFHRAVREDGISPQAKLIIRPDIEDRINHSITKACFGAENHFRSAIKTFENGFDFQPADRCLKLRISSGKFNSAPEWRYMVDLPRERYYGMEDKTDIFSPGYFTIHLEPGESVVLSAATETEPCSPLYPDPFIPTSATVEELAADALRRFVVRRDDLNTVIAGFPWFLDWGRDTLIVLRGLIKFPEFHSKAAEIIRRFAAFERSGTIPNMICGGNDSNRDTSDAPLYLITAVKEYISESGDKNFLSVDCGERTLKEILLSIVENYCSGTPNGIKMDHSSGLIFSPSHFTWMDTNYPAGTPREGYPVEIQSLWFAALDFLEKKELAEQVKKSINDLYFTKNSIADCLHCKSGVPAAHAIPDDHLRCNILTAITMGAVTDKEKQLQILSKTEKLLIPGAIRTLDDANVSFELPVVQNNELLNNPKHPYLGEYRGPEDTSRKVSYHNGTAWCWPFPTYCEALYITGKEKSRKRALALLMSCVCRMEEGVIGEMPEVIDGNIPHKNGGCLAQAWSISEFLRLLKILKK